MTKPTSTPTKTCSACGIEKPLSAFLHMSGKESGSYGSVCATCRGANRDQGKSKDIEEGSRTSTTVTIDTKSKVKGEQDTEKHLNKVEEDYHEERDKDELIENERLQKVDTTQKEERKHRESILGRRSFLSATRPITTPITPTERANQQAAREAHNVAETTKQETTTKEDLKEKEIDLTAPVEDTRFGKKEKHKGIGMDELRKQAPLFRTFSAAPSEPRKDTPSEFIEKKWGPGSGRSK